MHVCVGLWGHAMHMRMLQRPSETTIAMQDYGHSSLTPATYRMVVSWSPFSLKSAFAFEALPQNCLLGAADLSALCLQG